MMRKQLFAAGAAGAVVAACIASLSAYGSGSNGRGFGHVIRLVEVADVQKFIPAATGDAVGTRYIFSSTIYDTAGRRIGRDGGDCVLTNPDGTVECMISVRLPGGQLTFQGLAQGSESDFALTGGTGAFRNARGEAHAVDTAPGRAEVTIRLIG
jgi:Allene oxide cyclase barrel like domain